MDHNGTYNNETDEDDSIPGFVPLVDTLPIIIALLILASNGIVLALFFKNHRLRNITNTILVSLAISDLTTGLFGIPFYLVCSATHHVLCKTSIICWRFTSTSTVLHLLLVTLDRYAAIVQAIRYHSVVTRKRATVAIFTIWSVAAVTSLIQLSWPTGDEAEQEQLSEEAIEQAYLATGIYQSVTLGVFFAFPLLVMIFSYIRIFSIVRYHEKQIRRQSVPSSQPNRKKSKIDIPGQWKSAIVFIVMICIFVVCWFPYFFYQPLNELLSRSDFPHWVEYVFFYYPRFITSLANPVVYIIGKHDFRKAITSTKQSTSGTQMTSLISRGRSL